MDYSVAYYIFGTFLVLSGISALKVDVRREKADEKVTKSLKKLFTSPAITLFTLAAFHGVTWGLCDSYLYVYLEEELGASSSLISICSLVGMASGIFLCLFTRRIVDYTGEVNMIAGGLILDHLRLGVYSIVG